MRMVLDSHRSRQGARALVLSLGLTACKSELLLDIQPASIDWGEINFAADLPEEGYAPQELTLTNSGEDTVELRLVGFDFENLCLPGFSAVPSEMGTLEPGQLAILTPGVCAYPAEQGYDIEVTGQIVVEGDGQQESIPWSYVPIYDPEALEP